MLAVELGLPRTSLVTPPNERYGKQLMREMMAGGNFGKYDDRLLSGVSHSKLVANLQRFVRDARMVMPIIPVNACGSHGSDYGIGCGGKGITKKLYKIGGYYAGSIKRYRFVSNDMRGCHVINQRLA
jgi:hypothetical protein